MADTQKSHVAHLNKFTSTLQKYTYEEYTNSIRKDICDEICSLYRKLGEPFPAGGITLFDVHIVSPRNIAKDKFSTPIIYRNTQDSTPTDMLSYTKNWAQAFNVNKWSGYVFTSPHVDASIAFKASLTVLQKHMDGIVFSRPDYYVKRLSDSLLSRIDSL